MDSISGQYVDPVVSRTKFDREIAEYRSYESDYRAHGWFLLRAEWPEVTVLLASKKTSPPSIVTAVRFDYTNYDAEPPSVRFMDPFSGRCLLNKEIPVRLNRATSGQEVPIPLPGAPMMQVRMAQDLLQANSPDEPPFLCIAGVKEYHDHPGHSGDPWAIHRSAGEGRLVRLLEVISKYGLEPVNGFRVNLAPQVSFSVSEPPS